jgi:hypothetical protein
MKFYELLAATWASPTLTRQSLPFAVFIYIRYQPNVSQPAFGGLTMPSIPIGIIAATLPSPIKQTQPPVKQQPTVVFPPIDTKPILGGIDQML